jgi:membrane-associated protein
MFETLVNLVSHTKDTVEGWSGQPWFAWVLFAILFVETGVVVMPFLPGDSLLFVVGAIVAAGKSSVSLPALLAIMSAAAVLGDTVNYHIGRFAGPAVFKSETSRLLNRKHLLKAHAFYETYGAKTIVLARFVPIVRTFAPFVAGIGRMRYSQFLLYNVAGGAAWVVSLTMAGVWFAKLDWVSRHFEAVVMMIVVISLVPIVVEAARARRAPKA